jgi:MtN3 and saliva related transmembrane protein
MYVVTVSAFVLWTVYGFVIGSLPLIVFNASSLVLSAAILALKLRHAGREGAPRAKPAAAPAEPAASCPG